MLVAAAVTDGASSAAEMAVGAWPVGSCDCESLAKGVSWGAVVEERERVAERARAPSGPALYGSSDSLSTTKPPTMCGDLSGGAWAAAGAALAGDKRAGSRGGGDALRVGAETAGTTLVGSYSSSSSSSSPLAGSTSSGPGSGCGVYSSTPKGM